MKILYIGDLHYGATARMWMHHLGKLGHQIESIDTSAEPHANFVFRNIARVSWRLGWPLDLLNVNPRIIQAAKHFRPDVVWIDKGLCVTRKTILELKRINPVTQVAHYNPDNPFGSYGKRGWRTFIAAIPAYDIHFIPRRENVSEYRACGAKEVKHLIPTRGFDPDIHRPYGNDNDLMKSFRADVGFLGAFEKERAAMLHQLADQGISIRLMKDWPSSHWHPNYLRAPCAVRGSEYAKALCSFKIGLCFLRKANRDQHTSRSIEIPACGTFLLAERTDEHLALFEEDKEAAFFSSDSELIDKVRYYLANDSIREKIAIAGRERCLRSGYDYTSRLLAMLDYLSCYNNRNK
jgi:hypothetical protein